MATRTDLRNQIRGLTTPVAPTPAPLPPIPAVQPAPQPVAPVPVAQQPAQQMAALQAPAPQPVQQAAPQVNTPAAAPMAAPKPAPKQALTPPPAGFPTEIQGMYYIGTFSDGTPVYFDGGENYGTGVQSATGGYRIGTSEQGGVGAMANKFGTWQDARIPGAPGVAPTSSGTPGPVQAPPGTTFYNGAPYSAGNSPVGGTAAPAPTPTPQPLQFTPNTYSAPTYSGGSGGSGGGGAPAPYKPQAYNGPTSPTNVQYNGPDYQISPFQAPQYEPVNLDQYFQQYSQYLMPNEQETGLKQTINDLMASYRAGLTNVEGQAIAMPFVTGQSAALDVQAEREKSNLLEALGLAQGNRLAMGDVAKAQYNFANEEALRRQHAGENAFSQWSTTQQLMMSQAKQGFDQWAAEQGLSQQAADQAFQHWATTQGINLQASGQAYDQWQGNQQLSQSASQNNFNQWLQQQQLALQAQGMNSDEAYRAAQLQLQQQQLAQGNQITPYQQATLAQNQSQFDATQANSGQMTDYQKAQTELDYAKQVAALQQQVQQTTQPAGSSAPAPRTTSTPVSVPAAPSSGYTGPSIVDYLASVGKPSDYNSRAQLAASLGITNYTGTAAQNTQMLNALRGGSISSSPRTTTGRTI